VRSLFSTVRGSKWPTLKLRYIRFGFVLGLNWWWLIERVV